MVGARIRSSLAWDLDRSVGRRNSWSGDKKREEDIRGVIIN